MKLHSISLLVGSALSTEVPAVNAGAYTHYGGDGKDGDWKEWGLSTIQEMDLGNLANHGCWCSKIGGAPNEGPHTVDAVDELCKEWFMKRRCLKITGGDCNDGSNNGYFVWNMAGTVDEACDDDISGCAGSTCRVDEDMRRRIWLAREEVAASGSFPVVTTECGVQGNPRPNPVCVGTAPDLELDFPKYAMSFPQEERIQRNNYLGDVSVHMEEFRVSFEIKLDELNSINNNYANLMHIGDHFDIRMPSIWLVTKSTTRLSICNGCGHVQKCQKIDMPELVGEWFPIVVEYRRMDDERTVGYYKVGPNEATKEGTKNCYHEGRWLNGELIKEGPLGTLPVYFASNLRQRPVDWASVRNFKFEEI